MKSANTGVCSSTGRTHCCAGRSSAEGHWRRARRRLPLAGVSPLLHDARRGTRRRVFRCAGGAAGRAERQERRLDERRTQPGHKGRDYVLRKPKEQSWFGRLGFLNRSGFTFQIPDRDEAGARALSELESRGVSLAADALAQSAEHILGFLTVLRSSWPSASAPSTCMRGWPRRDSRRRSRGPVGPGTATFEAPAASTTSV